MFLDDKSFFHKMSVEVYLQLLKLIDIFTFATRSSSFFNDVFNVLQSIKLNLHFKYQVTWIFFSYSNIIYKLDLLFRSWLEWFSLCESVKLHDI